MLFTGRVAASFTDYAGSCNSPYSVGTGSIFNFFIMEFVSRRESILPHFVYFAEWMLPISHNVYEHDSSFLCSSYVYSLEFLFIDMEESIFHNLSKSPTKRKLGKGVSFPFFSSMLSFIIITILRMSITRRMWKGIGEETSFTHSLFPRTELEI